LIFALIICGTASADNYVGGKKLTTIENGTVSGGLYNDSYYGFTGPAENGSTNDIKKGNVTYNYKPLPSNAKVVSAKLYAGIYIGNMQTDYPVDVKITFNGKLLEDRVLSSTYTIPSTGGTDSSTKINDHIIRVTSDYFMWYDVKNLLKQNNKVHIDTTKSVFDGRIKLITLLVAYDDGDTDKIAYWINMGQDVSSYNDLEYEGSTTFKGLPSDYTVKSATLQNIHMASNDGVYQFNGNILPSGTPTGSYSGYNIWDVTKQYKLGLGNNNVFNYYFGGGTGIGGYYKIAFALMTVKYTQPSTKLPDLSVTSISCNPDADKLAGKLFTDRSNTIKATIKNTGSGNAGKFNVLLNIGKYNLTKTITSLASGASTVVTFTGYKPTSVGSVTLKVTADSASKIKESNEKNNALSKSASVIKSKLPDLVITAIKVADSVKINKVWPVTVTIKNQGFLSSKATKVTLWVTDPSGKKTKLGTASLKSLDVNKTANLKFSWKPTKYGLHTLTATVDPDKLVTELNESNNSLLNKQYIKDKVMVFMTSDYPGTNILISAAKQVMKLFPNVDIQIRNGVQISKMDSSELLTNLKNCDIFIGDWVTTDAYKKINPILKSNPEIANKQVFLVLEPPVSTVPDSANMMKYSTLNKKRLLNDFTTEELTEYYWGTYRSTPYNQVVQYQKTVKFPALYNKGVLYKDSSNTASAKNEILWALSYLGYKTNYQNPPSFSTIPTYGIYRGKWYSYLDSKGVWHSNINTYKKEYFKAGRPCVAILESGMYIDAQELQPQEDIIEKLEARGFNVLPLFAYGGTQEQLEVMLRTFTNATDIDKFISNPSKYKVNVDAIVSMVAYGVGGSDFSKVAPFFKAANVEVIAAIHSDYETNAEYELGTSGLRNIAGDKWWHVAIREAQGITDPIFVGGMDQVLDKKTGGEISGYVPYEGNIILMADTLKNWVKLKHTSNANKKIALIYYNYPPGRQNIAASYLDPVQSVFNLLNILKEKGYNVKNIPSSSLILLAEMLAQGTNIANWAPGLVEKLANNNQSVLKEIEAFQKTNTEKLLDLNKLSQKDLQALANTPGVILYPVSSFMKWFNKLSDLDKLVITQGPVAYIGEICKRAVKLNFSSSGMVDMNNKITDWQNQMEALTPTNMTSKAVPLLKNIATSLKNYVKTRDVTYYNKFLTYKKQFLALNIAGMSGWGEAPGNIMQVTKKGVKYFVLPGIKFGNVLIAPEPQRGWEGNAEQLYHNTVVAPHYQYLAFYAYLQQQGYNAEVFIGRHATHEWLPGKEILPSSEDFTCVVTGGIPQVYFYIVDGLGEGLTAKRRGSAVIIDHLTPPMGFVQLYGGLSDLDKLVEAYHSADATKQKDIIAKIRKIIKDNDLKADIGVNTDKLSGQKLIDTVADYLTDIANTFYPYGLDILGEKWSDDQIALLVTSMLSVQFEIKDDKGNPTDDTTTLHNEIALLMYNKAYKSLSSSKQNNVQKKCIGLVKQLMHSNVATVQKKLTSKPTRGLNQALKHALTYSKLIKQSVDDEISSFLNALNGGFILPGPGSDPINNPDALPTGRNFFADQAAEIPTKEAYEKSKELTLTTLGEINDKVKKIAVGIWDTETARDNGALVCLVLRLLGIEPQWTPSPSAGAGGQKLKEMPTYATLNHLIRPDGWQKKRIDVVVVIDGNMRDLFSRQLGLIDKAFKIALARSYNTILNDATLAKYGLSKTKTKLALDNIMAEIGYYGLGEESLSQNYVAYDWVQDFKYYLSKGYDTKRAGTLAIARIFAPPENDYGASMSQATRLSWTWNTSEDLAKTYLTRMGHWYSGTDWGTYNEDVFRRMLTGVEDVFVSRNTNLYGVLDNDDFGDYWAGLSNAIKYLNGKAPNMYVLTYGTKISAQAPTYDQYVSRELNTRLYNPEWIKGMMEYGYTGYGYFSKYFSTMFETQALRPEAVTSAMWDKNYNIFFKDQYNLGVNTLNGENAYATISMTGTLLTAAFKGYWNADAATLQDVANRWAQAMIKYGVACCDCSCGNIAMMKWATQYINPDLLAQFNAQIYGANPGLNPASSSNSNQGGQQGQSTGQGSSSVGATPGEQTASSTPGESGEQGTAHEISEVNNQQGASSNTGMPIAATIGVILLVGLVAVGYFRGRIR